MTLTFVDPKAIEGKYKAIRDLLAKYGWYMSIKQDYIKNGVNCSTDWFQAIGF